MVKLKEVLLKFNYVIILKFYTQYGVYRNSQHNFGVAINDNFDVVVNAIYHGIDYLHLRCDCTIQNQYFLLV